jgi:hypothetical protein
MGILESKKETNAALNAALERHQERGKDRAFAAAVVCYALRRYNEHASTSNWHRVSEKMRAFDAAEAAEVAAYSAFQRLADEVQE